MSIATYNESVRKSQAPEEKKLDGLRQEFDILYAQMQTPAYYRTERLLRAEQAFGALAVSAS